MLNFFIITGTSKANQKSVCPFYIGVTNLDPTPVDRKASLNLLAVTGVCTPPKPVTTTLLPETL